MCCGFSLLDLKSKTLALMLSLTLAVETFPVLTAQSLMWHLYHNDVRFLLELWKRQCTGPLRTFALYSPPRFMWKLTIWGLALFIASGRCQKHPFLTLSVFSHGTTTTSTYIFDLAATHLVNEPQPPSAHLGSK